MRNFLRPLSAAAGYRSRTVRVTLLVAALLMVGAAPANAVVTEVEGVSVGLQARTEALGATAKQFANNSGNSVLHGVGTYAVYWDPAGTSYHHEWLTIINSFFHRLGEANAASPFGVTALYRDRSNAVTPFSAQFKGNYSDTAPYPEAGCTDPRPEGSVTCLTDAQLRAQLQSFIAAHHLPTGMGSVFYLLTPPGVTVCLDAAGTHCSDYKVSAGEESKEERKSTSYKQSFCSYHAAINPSKAVNGDASTVVYAAIPWTAGSAGLGSSAPFVYSNAYDCQDGGITFEKGVYEKEKQRELSLQEEEAFAKLTAKQKEEFQTERRLEGPHIEEPNQEGKDENGDYRAGLADLIVNQVSVETMNTASDPLLNSWRDENGNEATDMCRNAFGSYVARDGLSPLAGSFKADVNTEAGTQANVALGGGHYYINNIFNAGSGRCQGGAALVARFTSPDPVNSGETVGLNGMESTVGLLKGFSFGASGPPTSTYATFRWNFGDGTPEVSGYAPGAPPCEVPWLSPCAASVFHSYQYGGTYEPTLTVTDVAGNSTAVKQSINVVGPAPPSENRGAGGGSGGSGGSGASTTASTTAATSTAGSGASTPKGRVLAPPVAAQAVLTRSLRSVLRKGLVVSYAVNEQVAGHFEVLMPRSVASRLGIAATPASGLPAGTPPQVVIGKALLVTTAGGHSTVRIVFSKRVQSHLARARRVSLMLRLVVRNGGPSPASATVLSTFTLS